VDRALSGGRHGAPLVLDNFAFGQSRELPGMTQFAPLSGGMKPLDRAWNGPDLWKKKE